MQDGSVPNQFTAFQPVQNSQRLQPAQSRMDGPLSIDDPQVNAAAQVMQQHTLRSVSLEKFREGLYKKYGPDRLQQLQNNGIDPVKYYFKQQALNQFKIQRNKAMAAAQGNGQPRVAGNSMNPSGMQNQAAQRSNADSQNVAAKFQQNNSNRDFDSSQLEGLQAEARRSQANGDLVVPASNNTTTNGQFNGMGPFAGHPNATATRKGQAQNGLTPEQIVSNQTQRDRVHRATQASQAGKMPSNASQKQPNPATLQGQVGGLHPGQQLQQSSPAMSMLNRPLGQPREQGMTTPNMGNQAKPQGTTQAGPRQHSQSVGQTIPTPVSVVQSSGTLNLPPDLPEKLKETLRTMVPGRAQHMIEQYRLRQQVEAQAKAQAQSQTQAQAQSQMQAATHQRQDSHMTRPDMPMGQSNGMIALTEPNLQDSMRFGWQREQMPQQQQNIEPHSMQRQVPPNIELRLRSADSLPFLRGFARHLLPNIEVPSHIGTWGDLKMWLNQNPGIMPNQLQLQRTQLYHLSATEGGQTRGVTRPGPSSQAPVIQQQQQSGLISGPLMQNRVPQINPRVEILLRNGLVQYVNGALEIRPVNAQDLQDVRTRMDAKASRVPDQQLGQYLMRDRSQKVFDHDPDIYNQIKMSHQQSQVLNAGQGQLGPSSQAPQMRMPPNQASRPQGMPQMMTGQGMPNALPGTNGLNRPQDITTQASNTMNGRPAGMFGQAGTQPQQQPMMQPPSVTDINTMQDQQRAQMAAQMRAARGNPSMPPQAPNMANMNIQNQAVQIQNDMKHLTLQQKEMVFNQLQDEIERTTPIKVSINLSQDEMVHLTSFYQKVMPQLQKMYDTIKPFFIQHGNSEMVKEMLTCVSNSSSLRHKMCFC